MMLAQDVEVWPGEIDCRVRAGRMFAKTQLLCRKYYLGSFRPCFSKDHSSIRRSQLPENVLPSPKTFRLRLTFFAHTCAMRMIHNFMSISIASIGLLRCCEMVADTHT